MDSPKLIRDAQMLSQIGSAKQERNYDILFSRNVLMEKRPVISQYILLTMWIDGRRLDNLKFLIVELGNNDVIFVSKLLAHYNAMIDSRQCSLVWPILHEKTPSFSLPIRATLQHLLLNRSKPWKIHQRNVKRRDRLMKKEEKWQCMAFAPLKSPCMIKFFNTPIPA